MGLRINDTAPDFNRRHHRGRDQLPRVARRRWALLFSHPKDFTPVCTTELGAVAGLRSDFAARNCKIIGISVDGVSDHHGWSADIEKATGNAVNYPLIGDPGLNVVKLYDMLPADAGDTSKGRTAADNATARSVFIIGPDKKIKATLTYPMTTGRNFAEILRLLDSAQLTATEQVATPGQLAAGRGRDHRPVGLQRGRRREVPRRLGGAPSLPAGGQAARHLTGRRLALAYAAGDDARPSLRSQPRRCAILRHWGAHRRARPPGIRGA